MTSLLRSRRRFAYLLLASSAACGGATLSPEPIGKGDGGLQGDAPSRPDSPPVGFEGGECNLVEIIPPILTVTDGVTGGRICDATLVGDAGGVDLFPSSGFGACTYTVNGYEGASSTFSISITAPSYGMATVTGLEIQYCGCSGAPCAAAQMVSVSLPEIVDGGGPGLDSGFDSGVDSGFDASEPACPATHPTTGAACNFSELYCEYGTDPNPYCNDLAECNNGSWEKEPASASCPSPSGMCAPYATLAAGGSCAASGQTCASAEGTCVCSNDPGGLPIEGGPFWSCSPAQTGCPSPRPQLGTPCSGSAPSECDYGACSGGVAEDCVGGYWALANIACAG
jgi:hypothetical protein